MRLESRFGNPPSRKHRGVLLVTAVAALLIVGCGSTAESVVTVAGETVVMPEPQEPVAQNDRGSGRVQRPRGTPIVIGVAGPHTGDLASYGLPSVAAVELVVATANDGGGVLGRPVELLVKDDRCDPGTAQAVAEELVSEGAVAVIGHICSGATASALDIYEAADVLTISPSAVAQQLSESPVFFRTIPNDGAQAQTQVSYAVNSLRVQRVAVVHDGGSYGESMADAAVAALQDANIDVAVYEEIDPDATDFSAAVGRIRAAGVDAVFWGGYARAAGTLRRQLAEIGAGVAFIVGDGAMNDDFLRAAGNDAEGAYATAPPDISNIPAAAIARREHVGEYGEEAGPFFLNAYSAAVALLAAIETAGSTDLAAMRSALITTPVDTPLGTIRFSPEGEILGYGLAMYQVRDGSFVQVTQ